MHRPRGSEVVEGQDREQVVRVGLGMESLMERLVDGPDVDHDRGLDEPEGQPEKDQSPENAAKSGPPRRDPASSAKRTRPSNNQDKTAASGSVVKRSDGSGAPVGRSKTRSVVQDFP